MKLSLLAVAADLASGRTTSRALVEAALAKAEDPAGEGATTFTTLYADAARASAEAADALRRAGRAPGPFTGVPVTIKDLFDVAGEVTRAGSRALADAPPATTHAPAVARLLGAGFVLVGRTNMTEFAFSGIGINPHYGTPRAPWDRKTGRIPGGSSSGAAVAVADGMAVASLGTDTGGSCRIPAAFCGVVGWKPTARRVPIAGTFPLAPSLDSVGPLAADVASCAAIDAVLAGGARPLLPREVAGLRLVLPLDIVLDGLDRPTEDRLDRAVARLHDAGALIERRRFPPLAQWREAQAAGGLAAPEAYDVHRDLLSRAGALYDPRIARRIRAGAEMRAPDYVRLLRERAAIRAAFAREMAEYDALLAPTVPIVPPTIAALDDEDAFWRANALALRNTSTINFFDGCAITLPCHGPGEPPAGLMLAGPAMSDRRLLSVARAIEAIVS